MENINRCNTAHPNLIESQKNLFDIIQGCISLTDHYFLMNYPENYRQDFPTTAHSEDFTFGETIQFHKSVHGNYHQ